MNDLKIISAFLKENKMNIFNFFRHKILYRLEKNFLEDDGVLLSIFNFFWPKKQYRLKENFLEDDGVLLRRGQIGVFVGFESCLIRVRFDTYTVSLWPRYLELV